MKRGISFEIPNQYGKFLGEIVSPLDVASFNWGIDGESYTVEKGEIKEPLLPDEIMDGSALSERVKNNFYYCIFADLKAFPKDKQIKEINTYDEFLKSDCQVVLLLVDCSFVTIYCKDSSTLELLYGHAKSHGFDGLEYVTEENDKRIRLSVW